jgi:hypothetical protein
MAQPFLKKTEGIAKKIGRSSCFFRKGFIPFFVGCGKIYGFKAVEPQIISMMVTKQL